VYAYIYCFCAFLLFLFLSTFYPTAGVTHCKQCPVEIKMWAVLFYFFCKLFFVVLCHVGAVGFLAFFYLITYKW
jgi:hypothetical protein